MLTNEQINAMSFEEINGYFRSTDESHLWPVCGRFNATERGIKRLRTLRRDGLEINSSLSYFLALEGIISEIVNKCC